jgi:hypothetical protein
MREAAPMISQGTLFRLEAAIAALILVAHPRAGSERWQNERTETLGDPMTALLVPRLRTFARLGVRIGVPVEH